MRPTRSCAVKAIERIRKSVGSQAINEESEESNEEDDSAELSEVDDSAESVESGEDELGDHEISERTVTGEKRGPNETNRQRKLVIEFWSDYIDKPSDGLLPLEKKITGKWKRTLKTAKKVKCPREGCESSFTTVAGLTYHYRRCGLHQSYKCKLCDYSSDNTHRGLLSHMVECHSVSFLYVYFFRVPSN